MTREDILQQVYDQTLSIEDAEMALARKRLPPLDHLQASPQPSRPAATIVLLFLIAGLLLLLALPALFFLFFFGMMA